jgi:MFS family permease
MTMIVVVSAGSRVMSCLSNMTKALSVFAAASGSGFAAGMILGGVITATLGWRCVFDINVPIGLMINRLHAHTL